MAKKGLSVWIFSSLTFVATLHLIDAVAALVFGNSIKLFQLYPFVNEKLEAITPQAYFWIAAAATLVLWGITCAIAFENPVEVFLNKILSDAKSQSTVESQLIENKSEVLDAMFETMESNNQTLAQVKDLICNVRAEAKEIQPLKEDFESMRTELSGLKKEIKRIGEIFFILPNLCPSCSKPLMPEFKICPYCGENVKLQKTHTIELRDYK